MTASHFPAEFVNDLVNRLMGQGMPPRKIRQYLSDYGIRWQYQFRGNGLAEKVRRLKRQGRVLCSCRQDSYPTGGSVDMCQACLVKKFSPDA